MLFSQIKNSDFQKHPNFLYLSYEKYLFKLKYLKVWESTQITFTFSGVKYVQVNNKNINFALAFLLLTLNIFYTFF